MSASPNGSHNSNTSNDELRLILSSLSPEDRVRHVNAAVRIYRTLSSEEIPPTHLLRTFVAVVERDDERPIQSLEDLFGIKRHAVETALQSFSTTLGLILLHLFRDADPLPSTASTDDERDVETVAFVASAQKALARIRNTDVLKNEHILIALRTITLGPSLGSESKLVSAAITTTATLATIKQRTGTLEYLSADERRAAIIRSIIDDIAAAGFAGTNLSKIAPLHGETSSGLRRKYGKKNELFHAAVETICDELSRVIRHALETEPNRTAEECLQALGVGIFEWGVEQPTHIQAIFHIALLPENSELSRYATLFYSRYFDAVRGVRDRVIEELGADKAWFNTTLAYASSLAFRFAKDWDRCSAEIGISPNDEEAGKAFRRQFAKIAADFTIETISVTPTTWQELQADLRRRKRRKTRRTTTPSAPAASPSPRKQRVINAVLEVFAGGGAKWSTVERVRDALLEEHRGNMSSFDSQPERLRVALEFATAKLQHMIRSAWERTEGQDLDERLTEVRLATVDYACDFPHAMLSLFRMHYQRDEPAMRKLWQGSKYLMSLGNEFEEALHTMTQPACDAWASVHGEASRVNFRLVMVQNFYARGIDAKFLDSFVLLIQAEYPHEPNMREIFKLRLAKHALRWLPST